MKDVQNKEGSMSMKTTKEIEKYISWDTCEIARNQAEHLLEQAKENGEELSEEEAFNQACGDTDLYEFEYEDLCDCLTSWMNEINESGNWDARVENFGWRKQSGRKILENVTTGKELLREILPKTECTFRIYHRGDHLAINNAHHDSPCFDEFYYVYPCCVEGAE